MFVEMKRYSNVNVCRSGRLLRETRAFRVGCAVPHVSYCDRLEQWAGQWVYARPSVYRLAATGLISLRAGSIRLPLLSTARIQNLYPSTIRPHGEKCI